MPCSSPQYRPARARDPKLGIANQLPVFLDGRATESAQSEAAVAEGYVGKCPP